MKRSTIEEVVLDQIETLKHKKYGIGRSINLEKAISTQQITIISGIRRSGKSTLLLHLMKHFKDFSYLNFDDERLLNFEVADFQTLLAVLKKYSLSKVLFFDEIQNVNKWEHFIRRIFDEGYKIFITGSNAKLLSSELATHLTGRYIKIELFPFSFMEILDFHKINYKKISSNTKAKLLAQFDNYLTQGGFPEMVKFNDNEYLKRIYEDIIYRDLIVRYKIRNIKQFKNLSQYLFTNFTGEISYNSLKSALNIKSTATVQEYISYLEESYLVFELYKYDYSLKKQYISNKKIYVIDSGVRNRIAFKFSDDKGKFLENMVFLELKRRQKEIYFFKTKNKREIDFLYNEKGIYHLIQVSYSLEDYKTRQRELKAFVDANKEIPNTKNIILTYSEEETLTFKELKIEIIPAWKWLLSL